MAAGIEHREKDSLMDAFDYFDMPCFSICVGTQQRTGFCCESVADAREKFEQFVDFVLSSGNQSTYLVKFFPAGTKSINNKTPNEGSTTFMLNTNVAVKNENGIMVIDRDAGRGVSGKESNNMNAMLMNRLEKLEAESRANQQKLFDIQIKHLEEKFTSAISGTNAADKEKQWWEIAIEHLERNPNALGNILNPIKDAIMEFIPGKRNNYIQNPTTPVGRTEARVEAAETKKTAMEGDQQLNPEHQDNDQETDQIEDLFLPDAGGIRQNPILTEEEQKLGQVRKDEIIIAKLAILPDEQHEDLQNAALDSVANRIGNPTLTRMLLAVACMGDKEMNKLLNHLD